MLIWAGPGSIETARIYPSNNMYPTNIYYSCHLYQISVLLLRFLLSLKRFMFCLGSFSRKKRDLSCLAWKSSFYMLFWLLVGQPLLTIRATPLTIIMLRGFLYWYPPFLECLFGRNNGFIMYNGYIVKSLWPSTSRGNHRRHLFV